jgi:type II secretory pathway pseudopilin PulG
MSYCKRFQRGLTVPELLVVIGILLMLGGILFPVLASARGRASLSACGTNLGQIRVAMLLYANDGDDRFPRAKDCIDLHWPEAFPRSLDIVRTPLLTDALQPYLRTHQVFKCPSDSGAQVVESLFPRRLPLNPTAFGSCGNSYEYHTELGLASVAETMISNPTQVNVLEDLAGHWHGTGGPALPTESMDEFRDKTLNYRYQIVFADGHTKTCTHAELEASWRSH